MYNTLYILGYTAEPSGTGRIYCTLSYEMDYMSTVPQRLKHCSTHKILFIVVTNFFQSFLVQPKKMHGAFLIQAQKSQSALLMQGQKTQSAMLMQAQKTHSALLM